jgi:hypothetical protein
MKANAFEIAPVMIAVGQIHHLDESLASVALARAVLSEDAGPSVEPRPCLALRSAGHRTGEFWETVSYVVIWLCGLIGIGLCFF